MRGKGESDTHGLSKPGITPAYAGKSPGSCRCHLELRGSPPRMRGKVPCRSAAGRAGGITPAYAGKRTKQNTNSQGGKDHPRVCGEKAAIAGLLPSLLGSPPRMRGKAKKVDAQNLHQGITPAYAGKSTPSRCSWACIRDHPRVCGEKYGDLDRVFHIEGSPPRMRGKGRAHRVDA